MTRDYENFALPIQKQQKYCLYNVCKSKAYILTNNHVARSPLCGKGKYQLVLVVMRNPLQHRQLVDKIDIADILDIICIADTVA